MKKFYTILMMAVALAACTREEQPQPVEEPETTNVTYTLTVNATKSDDATKALSLSGNTLNATWAEGEVVRVTKIGSHEMFGMVVNDWVYNLGTLSVTNISQDGSQCTLTGELTETTEIEQAGGINNGDVLYLTFTGSENPYSMNSNAQDGTLTTIADYFDYASTSVTVSAVSNGSSGKIITASDAVFSNRNSIVKFTLTDKAGNAFTPTSIAITERDGNGDEDVYLDDSFVSNYMANGGFFYLVVKDNSGSGFSGDLTITASDGTNNYTYTKTGITFAAGQYYDITVKMQRLVDLSALDHTTFPKDVNDVGYYTVNNGDILTGEFPGNCFLKIREGATVTLNGITHHAGSRIFGIECLGSATIILAPGSVNDLTHGHDLAFSGINCDSGSTLTIEGTGTLNASGGQGYPGIGGRGDIVINGGIITATGGSQGGAGIGSASSNIGCGDITINGGNITAIGGTSNNLSIGGGAGIGAATKGQCGNITINAGTIHATGGKDAAGIGTGYKESNCGEIIIKDGVTSLTTIKGGGTNVNCIGMGSGGYSSCGTITIDGIEFDPWEINDVISSYTSPDSFSHFTLTISKTSTNINNDTWTFTHK